MSDRPTPLTDEAQFHITISQNPDDAGVWLVDADFARDLERKLAEANERADRLQSLVDYARRLGLHIAKGTSTDCPEGRLQHNFTEGSELSRIFDEWSDSIGHEVVLERTQAKLAEAREALEEACDEIEGGRFDEEPRDLLASAARGREALARIDPNETSAATGSERSAHE